MPDENESCFYRDKQGIKGLAAPFPCTPNPRRSSSASLRNHPAEHPSLTKPNTSMHNQSASVASLRRLFAFIGTPFGFPLESPFTFTGIPSWSPLPPFPPWAGILRAGAALDHRCGLLISADLSVESSELFELFGRSHNFLALVGS
jgi:hypothetical protein